jgi:hypothetical protein
VLVGLEVLVDGDSAPLFFSAVVIARLGDEYDRIIFPRGELGGEGEVGSFGFVGEVKKGRGRDGRYFHRFLYEFGSAVCVGLGRGRNQGEEDGERYIFHSFSSSFFSTLTPTKTTRTTKIPRDDPG